ncbi:MAG: DUF4112 domain-containing protein [Tepidisphaerales bacterium]
MSGFDPWRAKGPSRPPPLPTDAAGTRARRAVESAEQPRGGQGWTSGRTEAQRQAFLRDLRRCQALAWLLDARFGIGRIRFGVDAIVGLAPVVGDVLMALVGLYMAFVAWKHGLGAGTVLRIVLNLVIDVAIGAFPVLGDGADILFKAHLRNVRVLERRGWALGLMLSEATQERAEWSVDWGAWSGVGAWRP